MNHNILMGVAGGTMTGILVSLQMDDIIETCILSAIGAIVSYSISQLLHKMFGKKKRPE
ncbi:MAG: hypothetical protein H6567_13655 [Lewinellaceae bacterium]|nr:hypothetical protein [Lewinellaceae bacterium]